MTESPRLNKLSIEDVKEWTRVLENEFDDEAFSVRIGKQLVDMMRENERLRETIGYYRSSLERFSPEVLDEMDELQSSKHSVMEKTGD